MQSAPIVRPPIPLAPVATRVSRQPNFFRRELNTPAPAETKKKNPSTFTVSRNAGFVDSAAVERNGDKRTDGADLQRPND